MKFANFMFGVGLMTGATALFLLALGAVSHLGWLCLKAGWHIVGVVFP